ncbi:MAG: XRE family transcriptional regulator [Chloroflexota bacterium]|nr:MAG: XRE family transcriptional regulator [Chloroflexota bacterium]
MADRRDPRLIVGAAVGSLRTALGWTQRTLEERSGVCQSMISRIERGLVRDLTLGTASTLIETMGARLVIAVEAPYLADRARQHDAVTRAWRRAWFGACGQAVGTSGPKSRSAAIDRAAGSMSSPSTRRPASCSSSSSRPRSTISARSSAASAGTNARPGSLPGGSGGSRRPRCRACSCS